MSSRVAFAVGISVATSTRASRWRHSDEVRKWFSAWKDTTKTTGVYVIGYGGVLKATLDALVERLESANRSDILIACTSTLAGRKDWQPKKTNFDHRIVAVRPRLKGEDKVLPKSHRNVVLFFSGECLNRVQDLTDDNPDPDVFLRNWKNGFKAFSAPALELDQEHLTNGDIVVNVEIADSSYWRA